MNTGPVVSLPKVILDTNIIISALGIHGKPREILSLILDNQIQGVISSVLLAELEDVVNKKFPLLSSDLEKTKKQIRKKFKMVNPKQTVKILQDIDDNRVLEAAMTGKCSYIVTGDSDLLILKTFHQIKILTPNDFLRIIQGN